MPDLLTHVLIAYTLATVLSLRYKWITPRLATVAMAGGMIPDLNRFHLLIPADIVSTMLGVPFSWRPFHMVGGASLVILIGSLSVQSKYRRSVALLLALGVLSHFVLDMFLVPPAGSFPYLWPLTNAKIALPGFYRSGDLWMAPVALLLALGVRSTVRRRLLEEPPSQVEA